jgi:hypothetical protein
MNADNSQSLPQRLRDKYAAELKRTRQHLERQAMAQSNGDAIYDEWKKRILAQPQFANFDDVPVTGEARKQWDEEFSKWFWNL